MAESATTTLAKSGIAVAALGFVFTVVGFQFGGTALLVALVLFGALALATDAAGNISTAFTVTLFAVVVLLIQLLAPPAIFASIDAVLSDLGFPILDLNPMVMLFWAVVAILAAWVVDIRFISQTAKKPNTVAKRVSRRTQRLADEYATLGRVVIVGALGVGVVFLEQAGVLSGEIAGMLAQAPTLVANVLTGVLGFLALGGELPVVGGVAEFAGMNPMLFAAIVAILVLAAWGVRNQ